MTAVTQQIPFARSPERQHFDWLESGRFRLQHCMDCKSAIFYPRSLCPHCGSTHLEWRDSVGHGTVYSVTVVRRAPKDGGDYNVALVDLAEGVRMMSRIDRCASTAPYIGMTVRAMIEREDDVPIIVFIPGESLA